MTYDDIARIKTDDQTLNELAAGYQPGPEDEKLVKLAAAYRNVEREKSFQTLSELYNDAQQLKKQRNDRTQRVLFAVVIVAAVLGLFTGSLAFTLVAAGSLLAAWALKGFMPAR